jgi:hypothetical protein
MSQTQLGGYFLPPSPRALRVAEAEAIYRLLRLIAAHPEQFGAPLTGKVTVEPA